MRLLPRAALIWPASLLMLFGTTASAEQNGKLIFEDQFERSESQELKDEVGNGWNTNSKARAGGNKQVDLRDGAMYITMHPTADHAVSVTHPIAFLDGVVELRFMLENAQDALGLDFADLQYKEVHAGHLFKVDVKTRQLQINDMKTGNMNLKYYDAKKAGTLTAEQKKSLEQTVRRFPVSVKNGEWHSLRVEISGDTVNVSINAEPAGSFTSPGFAHPTKRLLRIAVPHSAVVDDVRVYQKN